MSTRLSRLIGRTILLAPGLGASIGWRYLSSWHLRSLARTPRAFLIWWLTVAAFDGAIFLLLAVPMVMAFRRRLPVAVLVVSVYNLFMVCLFSWLFFVSTDEAAAAALASISLGLLGWVVILPAAVLWAIALAYQFGKTVDSYRELGPQSKDNS